MTPDELRTLPTDRAHSLPPLLLALWHETHTNHHEAHMIVQRIPSREAARVHAYLHRKERDAFNANYWYRMAGVPAFTGTLEAEWEALAADLLARSPAEILSSPRNL